MHGLLLAASIGLPALAALTSGTLGRRRSAWTVRLTGSAALATTGAALLLAAAVVGGTDPSLVVDGTTWLRVDAVGALLLPVVGLVASTVLRYARQNLAGDTAAWRFSAGAGSLLAGTVLVLSASRLDVLVAGWVVGSAATVALCGYRGDPGARAARRTAAVALGIGDLGLLLALGILAGSGVDMDLAGLAAGASELSSDWRGQAVALLLVLAALARAGQLPLPRWLPGTVAAPTPVSALLHAGAVNAGAVLLVRAMPLLAPHRTATTALAVAAGATVVVAWVAMRARPDTKGALAESTGAQMGFMLLAVAVGAPVAALAHLAGHAMYKSARFLGAGGAIARQVAGRRWALTPVGGKAVALVLGAAAGAASLAAWWSLSGDSATAERWVIGVALAGAAAQAAAVVASQPARVALPLAARTTAVVVAALLAAAASHHALHGAVPHVAGSVPLWPTLAALGVGAVATHVATSDPRLYPRLLNLVAPSEVPIGPRHPTLRTPGRHPRRLGLEAA